MQTHVDSSPVFAICRPVLKQNVKTAATGHRSEQRRTASFWGAGPSAVVHIPNWRSLLVIHALLRLSVVAIRRRSLRWIWALIPSLRRPVVSIWTLGRRIGISIGDRAARIHRPIWWIVWAGIMMDCGGVGQLPRGRTGRRFVFDVGHCEKKQRCDYRG